MVGLPRPGSGQAGYVSPSPTLAAPSSGRLLPAARGSPGRGRRRRPRPPLTPAPLAPHTARSSRAPCVRRPSAGGWSCGCTWCPTRGRCPTRSGSACPLGRGPGRPPTQPFTWDGVRCLPLASLTEPGLPYPSRAPRPLARPRPSGPWLLSMEAVAPGPPPRVLPIRTGSLPASQAGPCPRVPPIAHG